ncbi:MAG TPA: hypothetical protein VFY44_06555, partial [Thermoleophilaceae bacterium]|nr:hypothetical protein [Thermoleophilaceae bacterium]
MAAVVAILAGPVALAFFSGGFFDLPRLWTAAGAWLLVLLATIAAPRPLPASTSGRCALAGLALLTAWTAVSLAWAPLRAPAVDDVQRLVLYLGGLLAACAFLRGERALRAVEPGVAAGTVVATLYGLSERLLPGLFELTRSASAEGRLDQPLTYWNAMGALTAIGLVLCARLGGDDSRPAAVRAAAAAAAPVLGLGLFLTLSRGAIATAAAGLLVLVVLCPTRLQLRAAVLTLVSGGVAAAAALALPAVRTLEAGQSARDGQGLAMLGVLLVVAAASA